MINFIVNPNAGNMKSYAIWKRLEVYLRKKRVDYRCFLTEIEGDAKKISYSISDTKDNVSIVIVGGEGTFNEVLDGLNINERISVAYIPTGHSKDLAKGLKLPMSPLKCLKRILNPKSTRNIDYGILSFANGTQHRRFIMSAGIGLDAELYLNADEKKEASKLLTLRMLKKWYSKLSILFSSGSSKGYVLIDGFKKIEFNHIFFISSHIHPYSLGGLRLAPKADNLDGELTICIVHQRSKLRLLRIMLSAVFGNHLKYAGVRNYDCNELKIHLESPMSVHTDGRQCGKCTDIHLHCVKQKLKFLI